MIVATLLHFALFVVSPTFAVAGDLSTDPPIVLEAMPDEPPLPERPPEVARPAAPVVGPVDVPDDATIEPTIPSDDLIALEPPREERGELGDAPVFTPMTIRPRLTNPSEVQGALLRHYPPTLRDAGIGGTVGVWFFLDEEGRVVRTQIQQSSGYEAFDQAALQVAEVMEFSPAEHLDRRVPVWVSFQIRFEVR